MSLIRIPVHAAVKHDFTREPVRSVRMRWPGLKIREIRPLKPTRNWKTGHWMTMREADDRTGAPAGAVRSPGMIWKRWAANTFPKGLGDVSPVAVSRGFVQPRNAINLK